MLKIFPCEKLYATINFNLRRFTILVCLSVPEIPSRKSAFYFGFYTLCGIIEITKTTIIYIPDNVLNWTFIYYFTPQTFT